MTTQKELRFNLLNTRFYNLSDIRISISKKAEYKGIEFNTSILNEKDAKNWVRLSNLIETTRVELAYTTLALYPDDNSNRIIKAKAIIALNKIDQINL